ncbi:hypothetical protein JCM10207_003852 [Rhodosporidiobolus poonsookiae]
MAHNATEVDVIEAFARILHHPPISSSSSAPVNFSVNVFTNRSKKNGKLATNANITLADAAVGQRFLDHYRSPTPGPLVRGRPTRCNLSHRPADPARVRQLQTNPFVSPVQERERQAELARLKEPIPLSAIEYGIVSEKAGGLQFATAYTRRLEAGSVALDGEKRVLVVSCGPSKPNVLFPLSSIVSLQHAVGTTSVLLTVNRPPRYTTTAHPAQDGPANDLASLFATAFAGMTLERDLPTRRIAALDREHAVVTTYCSSRVLLTFASNAAVEQFKHRRSDRLRIPKVKLVKLSLKSKSLPGDLANLQEYFTQMDLRVAFQLELLLRNGILGPVRVLELVPTVLAIAKEKGAEHAERILSSFGYRLANHRGERWDAENYDDAVQEDEYLNPPSLAKPFSTVPKQAQGQTISGSRDEHIEQLKHFAEAVPPHPRISLDQTRRLHQSRHVILTPSTTHLEGPIVDETNSILRRFPNHSHHFLRGSVRDEDMLKFSQEPGIELAAFLKQRFAPIFSNKPGCGLTLAGRTFSFLGYSQSALREHSTWFVAPFSDGGEEITAESLRKSLGDFSKVINVPARYMARIAQGFTATSPTLILTPDQIQRIPDITSPSGSCFTDGVDKISLLLAEEIDAVLAAGRADKNKKSRVKTTCYQFRLGGAKGMLAIDPLLKGRVVCLRPSMEKFVGESLALDIADTFDGPLPCYLNRPLIKILEDLGIAPSVFLDLQHAAVQTIGCARSSLKDAATMLDRVGLGGTSKLSATLLGLARLIKLPAHDVDPFLETAINVAVADALRSLQFKARIPVWGSHTLVGVADEDGWLKEGEIYACVKQKGKQTLFIEGKVCISRSPAVHPGDVQVVRAVGEIPPGVAPRLRSLMNCVVFSTKGSRSLPFCLGGGDLDGDIYSVICLPDLIPEHSAKPASYVSPPMKTLSRPSTIEDGVDFFLEYILADIMGIVANRHLQLADSYPSKPGDPIGTLHPDCIALAQLHSHAVDYPKTGTPVRFSSLPKSPSRLKPNFMVPEYWARREGNDKRYYTSDKALGQLFRAIPLTDTTPRPWVHDADNLDPARVITDALLSLQSTDCDFPHLASHPLAALMKELWNVLDDFCDSLWYIAHVNTLSKRNHLSEVEVLLGALAAPTKIPKQRQDLSARLQLHTGELFEKTRSCILGAYGDEEVDPEEHVVRAWAAWKTAVEEDGSYFGVKTFGFVALQLFFEGVKRLEGEEM